jgi:conjugal transfer pilus assembly protein TraB
MIEKIKAWFAALPPDKKRKVVLGGSVAVIILVIWIAVFSTDDGNKMPVSQKKKKVDASILTGGDPRKVGIEQISAENKRQESEIENLKRTVQALATQMGSNANRGGAPGSALPFPYSNGSQQEVIALPGAIPDPNSKGNNGVVTTPGITPVKAPDKIVQEAVSNPNTVSQPAPGQQAQGGTAASGRSAQSPTAARNADLPPPNIPGIKPSNNSDVYGNQGAAPEAPSAGSADVPPPPPKLQLRVLTPRQNVSSNSKDGGASGSSLFTQSGAGGGRSSLAALAKSAPRDPEFYAPMGSILSGTLLTGVDAPANGTAAKKDPFPALFRIKHEAILPNSGLLDLRECFIIASAYGDLSSERVYMRAEGLSCQRSDGAIIEASLDAYASGSDGKAGVRGVVIEKTGSLIARSLVAGFVGGIGKSFKPTQAPAVTTNPTDGSTAAFQYPDPSFVVGSGILGGGSAAAERIANIYEDLAKQIVPVIEINAGIPVDFIMTRGTTLRFKRVGETTGQKAASAPSNNQPTKGQTGTVPAADNLNMSVTGTLGAPFSVTPGPGTSTPAPQPTGANTTLIGRRP